MSDKEQVSTGDAAERGTLYAGKFLVVDDDCSIARVVSKMLRKAGASVVEVTSPQEAMEHVKQCTVDVVLTDFVMKHINGLELLAHIREADNSISVIVMTSHASPEVPAQAEAMGANGFLRKPFRAPACVEMATKALYERREKLGLATVVEPRGCGC